MLTSQLSLSKANSGMVNLGYQDAHKVLLDGHSVT